MPLRVAVEYLPPRPTDSLPGVPAPQELVDAPPDRADILGHRAGERGVVAEELESVNVAPFRGRPHGPENDRERTLWNLSEEEIAGIRNPLERTALTFIQELIGEDRRRMRRELGLPFMKQRHHDLTSHLYNEYHDDQRAFDEARYLSEHGRRLLNRPLRRSLKELTVMRDLEVAIEDFKAENVPISEAYQKAHPRGPSWGRMSVRLHASDASDPLEMAYKNFGLRVASSQEQLKVGYEKDLLEDLNLSVRTRHRYTDHDTSLRLDLTWYLDKRTTLSLVAGDDLHFLSSADAYSYFESPMDGSPGILLLAELIF